jgi:methionyl-tRNA formyltransferase
MTETNIIYKNLLNDYINNLPNILENEGVKQIESEGSYFPRLITETNGAIDWTINGDFIEKTIRAFSDPYPGAFTYIKDTKILIMESYFEKNNHNMHPLMCGKIIKHIEDGSIKVVVKDGYLYVTKIKNIHGDECIPSEVITHPGQFYTPIELIEIAKYKTTKVSNLNFEN